MNKTDYFGHTPPFGKRCPVCNCEVEDGKWRIIRPSGLWVCGKCIMVNRRESKSPNFHPPVT